MSRTVTKRAQCDDCPAVAPDDDGGAAQQHADIYGHTVRLTVQDTRVYVGVVPSIADDRPTTESLFRKAIRSRRDEIGWSQQQVADRLSRQGLPMHSTAISRIEAGTRGIGLDEAVAICAVLGMDAKEFLS